MILAILVRSSAAIDGDDYDDDGVYVTSEDDDDDDRARFLKKRSSEPQPQPQQSQQPGMLKPYLDSLRDVNEKKTLLFFSTLNIMV